MSRGAVELLLLRKLRMAREAKKAKTGRCEGRKPYGHYPGEDDFIKRIRHPYRKPHGRERLGCRAIATQLNQEGISTRSGVPWSGTQVKSILDRKT